MIHFVISDSANTAVNVSRVLEEKKNKQAHGDSRQSQPILKLSPTEKLPVETAFLLIRNKEMHFICETFCSSLYQYR